MVYGHKFGQALKFEVLYPSSFFSSVHSENQRTGTVLNIKQATQEVSHTQPNLGIEAVTHVHPSECVNVGAILL